MFSHLLKLTVIAALMGGAAVASSALPVQDDAKAEFEKKKTSLDASDAQAHYDLALWAKANGLKTDYKRMLRKVIKIDRDHADARQLLGYEMFDGKWVTAREKERLLKKKEEADMAAKGLRKWKGEWHPAADVEKLEQGLFKVEVNGQKQWVTEIEMERIEQGLVPYKGQWIKAEDKKKIDEGFFPFEMDPETGDVGKWLSQEEADKVHAELGKHWNLESKFCNFQSTCNYKFINQAMNDADKAVEHAYSMVGRSMPKDFPRLDLMLVSKLEDYNNIGNIAQENDDALMSSCWGSFAAPNPETGRNVGVTMYSVLDPNNSATNDNVSRYLVRHAASEVALRSMKWDEDVPRWFVTGIATYIERYWDPWHANAWKTLGGWSAGNLQGAGGLIKLSQFFEPFNVSRQSVLQSGLLISYLVHGQDMPPSVSKAWGEVQTLMGAEDQKGLNKAFIKLESALAKDGAKDIEAFHELLVGG